MDHPILGFIAVNILFSNTRKVEALIAVNLNVESNNIEAFNCMFLSCHVHASE